MNRTSLVALLGFAALAAQAQQHPQFPPPAPVVSRNPDPVVVTASRALTAQTTLRDAIVITREELDAAGSLSLGEVLQNLAGVELRATGGPGQPQGLFIRGAGTAQTLVLVDGMRVGSATVGTTSIEHIPLELIERIEVVKGPLSSLWGSEAMGGVVQVFTRGKPVPHLFVTSALGSDSDRRIAAGITTIDKGTAAVMTMGYREVDAPSATTERVPFCHDPDRDPYDVAYANLRVAQQLWQGENVALEAFGTRSRTHFDGCGTDDRNEQVIAGVRVTSSARFARDWASRLAFAHSIDELKIFGGFPDRFETQQQQVSWINDFMVMGGSVVGGFEAVRQRVESDSTAFAQDERTTKSVFAGLNQSWAGQKLEASWRRDDDDQFGRRDTGSVGYGFAWPGWLRASATFAHGFRAPTFYDLYGPASDFYQPNPNLRPEQNRSREFSLRSLESSTIQWRATYYDNRIEDLIVFAFPTVMNVSRARIKGVEGGADATHWGIKWKASLTFQEPRDEDTGKRLHGRADRFGTFTATRTWGSWTAGLTVHASGDRYDSPDERDGTRLPGYATADARVRYQIAKQWTAEVTATNITDKRYETSIGYEGARRGVMLSVRFEAF